jgi:hypothetical protein
MNNESKNLGGEPMVRRRRIKCGAPPRPVVRVRVEAGAIRFRLGWESRCWGYIAALGIVVFIEPLLPPVVC